MIAAEHAGQTSLSQLAVSNALGRTTGAPEVYTSTLITQNNGLPQF